MEFNGVKLHPYRRKPLNFPDVDGGHFPAHWKRYMPYKEESFGILITKDSWIGTCNCKILWRYSAI